MKFNIPAEFKHASGVYIIRNTVNDKVYVGSAQNFRRRFTLHRRMMELDKHHSRQLQNFCNKYGIESLRVELLEIVNGSKELLLQCEQKWIDFYKCCIGAHGFNSSPTAGSCAGIKQSAQVIAAKSIALKGLKRSPETCARLSESAKGRKVVLTDEQRTRAAEALASRLTPEAKEKRVTNLKAYYSERRAAKPQEPERPPLPPGYKRPPLTDEHKQKLSEAQKGKPSPAKGRKLSKEHRQAIGVATKGRRHTEEAKRKMSVALKGHPSLGKSRPHTIEAKIKMSAARKGRKVSEETKQKISASNKGRKPSEEHMRLMQSPECIAKRIATRKANRLTTLAHSSSSQLLLSI